MKIRYLAPAQQEIDEATRYYAAISPHLGQAFAQELRRLMRLVATMPTAWPSCGEGLRKCLMSRFPYLVIYAPLADELLVLAVGHQYRMPGYWRDRIASSK